jgi:hypothetical protein
MTFNCDFLLYQMDATHLQVTARLSIQHATTLRNYSSVTDDMVLLCEGCWLNSAWMSSLRRYQVSPILVATLFSVSLHVVADAIQQPDAVGVYRIILSTRPGRSQIKA